MSMDYAAPTNGHFTSGDIALRHKEATDRLVAARTRLGQTEIAYHECEEQLTLAKASYIMSGRMEEEAAAAGGKNDLNRRAAIEMETTALRRQLVEADKQREQAQVAFDVCKMECKHLEILLGL